MTSTVRYKFVKNKTTQPLTVDNFSSNCMLTNDGDDRQMKFVKRIITVADIGTDPGEIGHYQGAILDVIPPGCNVLWVQGSIFRGTESNPSGYNMIDNQVNPIPDPTGETDVQFALLADNSVHVIDISQGTPSAIRVNDTITAFIFIGYPQFSDDVMNIYP